MKQIIALYFCLMLLSCNNQRNKPYENVNIIREEEPEKKVVENPVLDFPIEFDRSGQLLMELEMGDVEIIPSDNNKIIIDYEHSEESDMDLEVYGGNNQVIVREKVNNRSSAISSKWSCKVPANINLLIRSQNGLVEIKNVDGTFEIESPVGDITISNSKSAMKAISQSGKIDIQDWEQMGRSKFSSASQSVSVKSSGDILYALEVHSGSKLVLLDLNGHELKANAELISFRDEGSVTSDFPLGEIEDFYSDALDRHYDLRRISLNKNYPLLSMSTGNGQITLKK